MQVGKSDASRKIMMQMICKYETVCKFANMMQVCKCKKYRCGWARVQIARFKITYAICSLKYASICKYMRLHVSICKYMQVYASI